MRAQRQNRQRRPNADAGATRVALASCTLLAAFALALAQARAQQAGPRAGVGGAGAREEEPAILRVAAPDGLTPGMRATVDVFVRPPVGPEQPLLLTPSSEGEAVHVVRGRLLRVDARRTAQGELHFQVPIEARSAGTAVLRFALLAYRCEQRCTAVRLSETITVQVRAK
jgi:hypothetical protein